jgi:hypothetical protein
VNPVEELSSLKAQVTGQCLAVAEVATAVANGDLIRLTDIRVEMLGFKNMNNQMVRGFFFTSCS